eukprot:TRINITY_DN11395_c0_g1_i1.p1 TRINITY_DN11395_c0_g1~~TRINITY_DN11395_c0_g1_i1.p1  ORF type:complete len:502 (-),score=69.17 TRINITY_DN11395_c0_g1_i1:456-1856(-)
MLKGVGLHLGSSPQLVVNGDLREGGLGELELDRGKRATVTILAVDMISVPHRARVKRDDTGEILTVCVTDKIASNPNEQAEGKEGALLDTRTTTVFQDFEDSFDLVTRTHSIDEACASSSPSKAAPVNEATVKAPISDAPDTKEPTNSDEACKATGSVSYKPKETTAVESLVSRMSSFDGFKDLWSAPVPQAKQKGTSEGDSAVAAGGWGNINLSESLSQMDSLVNRVASFDGIKDFWPATSSSGANTKTDAVKKPGSDADSIMEGFAARVSAVVAKATAGVSAPPGATFDRAELPPPADVARPLIHRALATPPMDMSFELPHDFDFAQETVCVSGPHGSLNVPVPPGATPGQRLHYRLGPKMALRATVPEGAAAGDTIGLSLPDGRCIQVNIPEGKDAGEQFDVVPPVLMVQVPRAARAGDTVSFSAPQASADGGHGAAAEVEQTAVVPEGYAPGQYFEVPLEVA